MNTQRITSLISLAQMVKGEVVSVDYRGKGRYFLELDTGQSAMLPFSEINPDQLLRVGTEVTVSVLDIGLNRQFQPVITVSQKSRVQKPRALKQCGTGKIKATVLGRCVAGLKLQSPSGQEFIIRQAELHKLPKECQARGAVLFVCPKTTGPSGNFATAIGDGLGLAQSF